MVMVLNKYSHIYKMVVLIAIIIKSKSKRLKLFHMKMVKSNIIIRIIYNIIIIIIIYKIIQQDKNNHQYLDQLYLFVMIHLLKD
jgi:hypothetical protein